MDGKGKINDIDITFPHATLALKASGPATGKKETKFPPLEFNRISIQQPEINFSQITDKGKQKLEWNGKSSKNNSLNLTGIKIDNEKADFKKMDFTLNHFMFSDRKGNIYKAGNGEISAQLKDVTAKKEVDKTWGWKTIVENFSAKNFLMDSLGKQLGMLNLDMLKLENFSLSSSSLSNPSRIADENSVAEIKEFTGQYNDTKKHFSWYNAGFDQKKKNITVDSFSYHPTPGQDEYIASQPYQSDYLRTKTGKILITGVDPSFYLRDTVMKIQNIFIEDLVLTDFRDMRPPFHAGIIKPLPAHLIQKIPFNISVDTLRITNGQTSYSELNSKNLETATIPITKMTVKVFPIKNYDLKNTDTIRIQVNGYLMDSIWIRLRIRESYTDSLAGFFMTVRIKPTKLLILNPIFEPLSSVRLQSGELDTLSLRVIAKDYFAYGEMKMYYHDLKIKFLNSGTEIKKGFLTGLKTFVANSFVIRNKNKSRRGRIFFLRNRERSFINYIVKITMSGVASSVGAKNNRKILRRYKKELRLRNLPPYDYDSD